MHIDPASDGAEEVNAAGERIRAGFYHRIASTTSSRRRLRKRRREFRGEHAIGAWLDRELTGDKVTTEPTATAGPCGEVIVQAVTDGEYGKTGLPDPLVLTRSFTARDDRIVRLTIIGSEPAPARARHQGTCPGRAIGDVRDQRLPHRPPAAGRW